ncbi:hypothetical protein KY363_00190 [Candidatus Woesearchaeota archaeon]|nr:hypothetical protein [Candidatus Woesearchaeota archaeon]
MRNSSRFQELYVRMQRRYGDFVKPVLSEALEDARKHARVAHRTIYDGERVASVDSIVRAFAGGLIEILNRGRFDTEDEFDWLAVHYGEAFETGAEDFARGFMYHSMHPCNRTIELSMTPKRVEFDRLMRDYESALVKNVQVPPPFRIAFEDEEYNPLPKVSFTFRCASFEIKK